MSNKPRKAHDLRHLQKFINTFLLHSTKTLFTLSIYPVCGLRTKQLRHHEYEVRASGEFMSNKSRKKVALQQGCWVCLC